MSNELREMAHAIIDRQNSHAGWWDCDDVEDSGPAYAEKVAKAYLALTEHPEDDDESVTYEEVKAEMCGTSASVHYTIQETLVNVELSITTKRQLRLLLELLGEVPK